MNETIDFFQEIYNVPVETIDHYYETYSNFSALSETFKIGQGDFDFVSIQNNQSRQSLNDANGMIKEQMDQLRYIEWDYKLYIIHQIVIFYDSAVSFYSLGYQVFLGWFFIHVLAQYWLLPTYLVLITIWLSGVFLYSITVIPVQLLIFATVASIYLITAFIIISVLVWLYEYTLYVLLRFIIKPITLVSYLVFIPFALPFYFLNELLMWFDLTTTWF